MGGSCLYNFLFTCQPTATPSVAPNTEVIAPTTAEPTLTGACRPFINFQRVSDLVSERASVRAGTCVCVQHGTCVCVKHGKRP